MEIRGYLASVGGQDPIQVVLVVVAMLGLVLWMQRTGRLSWRWHLDVEGEPVRRQSAA